MSPWPRRGVPLLPAVLRDAWRWEPLPSGLVERDGLPPDKTMADLDESFWESVRPDANVATLANHLSILVTNRVYQASIAPERSLPAIPGTIDVRAASADTLTLSPRIANALQRAGLWPDLHWLQDASLGSVLRIRSMGVRSMLELLCEVESVQGTEARTNAINSHRKPDAADGGNSALTAGTSSSPGIRERLRVQFPLECIMASDPRLKHLKVLATARGRTLAELAVSSDSDLADDELLWIEVQRSLSRCAALPLDRALQDLVNRVTAPAHRPALLARLGWDGRGGCTLEAAAALSGVTRERIRQIEKKVRNQLEVCGRWLPQLDAAIDLLNGAATRFESDASVLLRSAGLVEDDFRPRGVLIAAEVFDRKAEFTVLPDGLELSPRDGPGEAYAKSLRSLADLNHVTTVTELYERALREVHSSTKDHSVENLRAWLERQANVLAWLDDDHEWFWVRQADGRNRYANIANKVLRVTNPVSVESLRAAFGRVFRQRGVGGTLPRAVMVKLLGELGFRVEHGMVTTTTGAEPEGDLGEVESAILKALIDSGGAATGSELRDLCIGSGVNRHSFGVYLSYSPIVERLATGVYGIRGRSVDPGRVAALIDDTRRGRREAQRDSGWTKDGAQWIGLEVSQAVADSGVIYVPAAVRAVLGTGRFELYAPDGAEMGTLVVGDGGQAWGLTPFINRRGLDVGDFLIVALDTALSAAVVLSGGPELLDAYSDGDGWGPSYFLDEATRPTDLL